MRRVPCVVICCAVAVLCCLSTSKADAQRVLVVTSESWLPENHLGPPYTAECIVADLAAAGMSFDVVTYARFVQMPLSGHDIVMLSGRTTPTPVAEVASKCHAAMAEGVKVFVNGHWPHVLLDENHLEIERIDYTLDLFDVAYGPSSFVHGSPTVPSVVEKDWAVTSLGLGYTSIRTFVFKNPPDLRIDFGGNAVGFLYPNGGAIDSSNDYTLHLLDYAKVVRFLRGNPAPVGFAIDRIEGQPIASFEVHCDVSSDLAAIDTIDALSAEFGIPLVNILVYDRLTPEANAKWNSLVNPLMLIGNHTKTHPTDWLQVPDVNYETRNAVDLQREVIPATGDYFNFSGLMNPTKDQMDIVHSAGLLFGGAGFDGRNVRTGTGDNLYVQTLPVYRRWLANYAASTVTPLALSQTVRCEIGCWRSGNNYADIVKQSFEANLKYGLYTYGYFHDTTQNPSTDHYLNGVHMSAIVRSAMEYLYSQGCRFISTDQLILMLRDYTAANLDCALNPDGSVTVTAARPGALINEVKVGCIGDRVPNASGPSVVSQHMARGNLYVTLRPETMSVFDIEWQPWPPLPPPVVTSRSVYVSNASEVQWSAEDPTVGDAECEFAVGTVPGGADAQGWTFVGTFTSATLSAAALEHSRSYYVSVRCRRPGGLWTQAGVSHALVADLTPPTPPVVIDDELVQLSTTSIHAVWIANDEESGIWDYSYAIGTVPGDGDVLDWTPTTATEVEVSDLNLQPGSTYYVSVRARNSADLWSSIGSSDGITIISESPTIGELRKYPDGAPVRIAGNIVTAVYPGEFYIESKDRSAGIKVVSAAPLHEGDEVVVEGVMGCCGGERLVAHPLVSVVGSGSIRPLGMVSTMLGGGSTSRVLGPSGGIGLNNVGLLVTVCGRITETEPESIYLDDGSGLAGMNDEQGIRVVVAESHGYEVGQLVTAVGISALETDGIHYWRKLLTRRPSDVVVCSP